MGRRNRGYRVTVGDRKNVKKKINNCGLLAVLHQCVIISHNQMKYFVINSIIKFLVPTIL